MFWPPLLSLLVLWCTGSHSQPVLTQPASASVSPGSTTKISCVMSSGYSISGYVIAWYQQKPGNPPRYLLYYYTDSNKGQGSGVPSRFSASKDISSNTCHLHIGGALTEDEAYYYCGTYHDSVYVFGGGTTLFVTGGSPVPPNVHLYPPSPEEIESKGKATFVCLIHDFSPPGITVTWQADSNTISNGVETTKPMKVNEKYVSSSYLTLDPSVWKSSKHVTCKVRHEGNDYGKSVSHAECP